MTDLATDIVDRIDEVKVTRQRRSMINLRVAFTTFMVERLAMALEEASISPEIESLRTGDDERYGINDYVQMLTRSILPGHEHRTTLEK